MNTFNHIEKQAFDLGAAKTLIDGATGLGGGAYKMGKAGYLALAAALAIGGATTGHMIARGIEPKAVTKNSDRILTSEALATEIDVTERKIKDLERRREALKAGKKAQQPYDRFV